MAYRDKTQGFGFVYVDLKSLLEQRKSQTAEAITKIPKNAKTVNFNKDIPQRPPQATPSLDQIKKNLDRLQKLHQKLHIMLEELNHLTDDKKSKK